jgi:glycosyltransferase involved in cell wall biosynthesis
MSVSCLCITYLRKSELEEAIECFLRQEYDGKKELVIINDAENQTLVFDHPEVVIINSKNRFRTIGEKRNASVALAKYDYLATWDDDDIFLPHRLQYSMDKIKQRDLHYYKLNEAYLYSKTEGITETTKNLFFSSSFFSRELYTKTTGHGFTNNGEDAVLEAQIEKICNVNPEYKRFVENSKTSLNITNDDIYYMYRWGGMSYHLSLVGKEENALDIITKERSKKDKNTGIINLEPHWEKDYLMLIKQFNELQRH